MKKVVSTVNAPEAVGPYSQAIEANGFVFVSGQIPVDPSDSSVAETIEEQARRSLENLKAILEAAGTSLEKVVKTTVLLQDLNDFQTVNGIYAEYFRTEMPARACYQVDRLPMGVKIEIEAIAVK